MYFLAKFFLRIQNLFLFLVTHILFSYRKNKNPSRILVLKSARLGDFICTLPSLNHLRKKYPSAKIVLLTLPSASREMWKIKSDPEWLRLLNPGVVDEVVFFDGKDIYNLSQIKELREKIKKLDPELTFIFPFIGETTKSSLKKMLFLKCLGVKRNLYGWKKKVVNISFFRNIFYRMGGFQNQVFGGFNALAEYGITFDLDKDIVFNIFINEESVSRVSILWKKYGLNGKTVMAIFPGSPWDHKRWPLENFRAVSKEIIEKYDLDIVIIGGKTEKALGEELSLLNQKRIHNLVGQTSLPQTAEILRRSILFLGNDSGIAHLANAVGTRCVTIFSDIEFPGMWEPWYNRDTAVRIPVPCQFCFSYTYCPNRTMACIKGIKVERVLTLAKALIEKNLPIKKITRGGNNI